MNSDLFDNQDIEAYNRNARELGVLSVKVPPFYRMKVREEVHALGHTGGPFARITLPMPGRFDSRAPVEVDDFVDDRANMPESAADSIVRKYKGMKIPPRSLVIGTPGKVVRQLTDDEIKSLVASAMGYQELGATYRALLANPASRA